MPARPFLIGIGGPSGAGKSTLAQALAARFPAAPVALLSTDRYYRDLSHLDPATRAAANFDSPDSLDWELLESQLAELRAGRPIQAPLYDFATHTRRPESQLVGPAGLVILEGVFALCDLPLRRMLDMTIYVEACFEKCLERRLQRDVSERGRAAESVISQFQQTVRPMAEKYILPAAAQADLVVDGDGNLERAVAACLAAQGRAMQRIFAISKTSRG